VKSGTLGPDFVEDGQEGSDLRRFAPSGGELASETDTEQRLLSPLSGVPSVAVCAVSCCKPAAELPYSEAKLWSERYSIEWSFFCDTY
jgi:hypothetical protein